MEQELKANMTKTQMIYNKAEFMEIGDVYLTTARKVNGGKIQLELLEVIPQNVNPLGLFNRSDERFSSVKPTRAWLTAEPDDARRLMGIDLEVIEPDTYTKHDGSTIEVYPIGIPNPVAIEGKMKYELKVQITESTDIDEVFPNESSKKYALENLNEKVKKHGNGGFLFKDGEPIFRTTTVVFDKANHTYCKHDEVRETLGISASDYDFNLVEEESQEVEEKATVVETVL